MTDISDIKIDPKKIPSKGLLKQRFRSSAAMNFTGNLVSSPLLFLCLIDGGFIFATMAVGTLLGEATNQDRQTNDSKAGQIITAKVWADLIREDIERKMIDTLSSDLSTKNKSEKIHNLLGLAQALEKHLTVTKAVGDKKSEPVYYMTKKLAKDSTEDPLNYAIDAHGRPAKPKQKPLKDYVLPL